MDGIASTQSSIALDMDVAKQHRANLIARLLEVEQILPGLTRTLTTAHDLASKLRMRTIGTAFEGRAEDMARVACHAMLAADLARRLVSDAAAQALTLPET